ncbi:MAG: sigma-70 family RNA polymerase sigma factor [Planctomycetaceae bacterium]|nr:sigma-70 family RNA polymerase sigma factor [Planctomycetaceae bacterium]
MTRLPGGRFLRSDSEPEGPGVFTTLLRTYIEDRDRGALDAFFHLLYDQHFADLAIQVHSYGPASELTVHEVIDESMARLLEDVVTEKYRKAPESAAQHLKFLLRRRFIDRRRYWDRKHEDIHGHRETLVDPRVPNPARDVEQAESDGLMDRRLEEALLSLSANDQKIIRLRLLGKTYPEIAQELGIDEPLMRSYGPRATQRLMKRLMENAPTVALRLSELRARSAPKPESEEASPWPGLPEIRDALPRITERVRDAILRLHFEGVAREDLERELGTETLTVLLRRGYDLLEARFKVSFPEAFDRATS